MDRLTILRLAWGMALQIWSAEKDHFEQYPNELSSRRYYKAKEQLYQIEELLLREEGKKYC